MGAETQTHNHEVHDVKPEYLRPQPYNEQPVLPGFETQFVIEFVSINE